MNNAKVVNAIPNLKMLPYGGASAVIDPYMDQAIDHINRSHLLSQWLNDLTIHTRFLKQYRSWITSTTRNQLTGLDQFPISCYSLGTTESFDKFYLRHSSRRFRCFRGEYMYHAASWRNLPSDWKYIEDAPLDANDAVVLSTPFSDTGNVHPETDRLLDECDRLSIPVLIDSAFFGLCQNINFNYDRPCVTDVVFSLSKTFPVSHVRIGMRLTRVDDDDSLLVHHKTSYINRFGCGLGIELLNQWGPDYNCEKWGNVQKRLCDELGVIPSNTVIFGIDSGRYPQYNRGRDTSRLCLAKNLYSGILEHD
jgi:hypothetical protein